MRLVLKAVHLAVFYLRRLEERERMPFLAALQE